MDDNQPTQTYLRMVRNYQALLSATLIGSPVFRNNSLPAQNDNSNAISKIQTRNQLYYTSLNLAFSQLFCFFFSIS